MKDLSIHSLQKVIGEAEKLKSQAEENRSLFVTEKNKFYDPTTNTIKKIVLENKSSIRIEEEFNDFGEIINKQKMVANELLIFFNDKKVETLYCFINDLQESFPFIIFHLNDDENRNEKSSLYTLTFDTQLSSLSLFSEIIQEIRCMGLGCSPNFLSLTY